MHNLIRAFPDKPLPELVGIARGAYGSIGILAAEFFEIPYITKENIDKYVVFEGLEHVQTALAKGKGLLSIIAHFGNWEMMPAAFPIVVGPINIVYRPLDSPVMENLISWVRTSGGNELIAKDGAVLKIARQLARKKMIGILIDQNMAVREGTFVNFFGRPACTTISLAFLALKTGAPVLPGIHDPDGGRPIPVPDPSRSRDRPYRRQGKGTWSPIPRNSPKSSRKSFGNTPSSTSGFTSGGRRNYARRSIESSAMIRT